MKTRLFCLLGLLFSQFALADSGWRLDPSRGKEPAEFQESELPLPALPNPQDAGWFDLYVSNTFTGKPQILLTSIHYAPDNSVRYVLNNRSATGYDNISAEGLYCVTGEEIVSSEGSRLKIFAYADMQNQRWIASRNPQWQTIGGKHNATNAVRRVLYEAFCIDGRAKSDELLQKRVREQAGRQVQYDYRK